MYLACFFARLLRCANGTYFNMPPLPRLEDEQKSCAICVYYFLTDP